MTPQEIFEYKQRWIRLQLHPVRIHSDLRSRAKDYCKVQMMSHQWDFQKDTEVYQDTFLFEHHQDAKTFRNHFKEWVDIYPESV